MSAFYNAASFVLGLGAWGLGIAALSGRSPGRASAGSFGLCACALLLQLFEVGSRVTAGDFSAIEDTIGAVILAGVVLVAVTLILNGIALWRAGGTTEKTS